MEFSVHTLFSLLSTAKSTTSYSIRADTSKLGPPKLAFWAVNKKKSKWRRWKSPETKKLQQKK